jgi:hypothetical protein
MRTVRKRLAGVIGSVTEDKRVAGETMNLKSAILRV